MSRTMTEMPGAAKNTTASPQPQPQRSDGRRLRSERTRRLIVEAYMALVQESAQMPTAAQIAARAGYSVRSIFERFADLTALRVAVTDHAIAEARANAVLRDLEADRATRIRSQVEQRGHTCEKWLALWRILSADPGPSAELHQRIDVIRQLVVMRLEMMFKPELSTLGEADRRKIVLALEALTTFESWGRMRELYGLSFAEASTVWQRAIARLLPASSS